MKDPGSLDENVIFHIGETARLFHKTVSAVFVQKKFMVTVEQFGVLALLWYHEGLRQQDVADSLKRDKTTIARIIQNMIKGKLIIKVPDQLDKRNKRIFLTRKGKALQKEMVTSAGEVYNQALDNIQPADINRCLKVLKQIETNLK